jgi:hypothetical protein
MFTFRKEKQKQKNTSKRHKLPFEVPSKHGSTQNFNSFLRCNGRSRRAISCARLASGTFALPYVRASTKRPFLLPRKTQSVSCFVALKI